MASPRLVRADLSPALGGCPINPYGWSKLHGGCMLLDFAG